MNRYGLNSVTKFFIFSCLNVLISELIFFFFKIIQEGTNKQAVATQVEISQDGGYVGVGWEGKYMHVILKNTAT